MKTKTAKKRERELRDPTMTVNVARSEIPSFCKREAERNVSDFDALREDFIKVLASFGVKKVEDIPLGIHKRSKQTDYDVWIIR